MEVTNELPTDIVATKGEKSVLSNNAISLSHIQPCTREEVDTRVFLHVNHVANRGLRRITITTVDTNVVVIALYIFFDLNIL